MEYRLAVKVVCSDGNCNDSDTIAGNIFDQADASLQEALDSGSFRIALLRSDSLPDEAIDMIAEGQLTSEFTQLTVLSGNGAAVSGEACYSRYQDGEDYDAGDIVSFQKTTSATVYIPDWRKGYIAQTTTSTETNNFQCVDGPHSAFCGRSGHGPGSPGESLSWKKMSKCFVSYMFIMQPVVAASLNPDTRCQLSNSTYRDLALAPLDHLLSCPSGTKWVALHLTKMAAVTKPKMSSKSKASFTSARCTPKASFAACLALILPTVSTGTWRGQSSAAAAGRLLQPRAP